MSESTRDLRRTGQADLDLMDANLSIYVRITVTCRNSYRLYNGHHRVRVVVSPPE
jgi:hypothetical protein